MVRYVNFLISGGIVRSADVYAPIAMKAMWPKERTPELPLKICSAEHDHQHQEHRTAMSV